MTVLLTMLWPKALDLDFDCSLTLGVQGHGFTASGFRVSDLGAPIICWNLLKAIFRGRVGFILGVHTNPKALNPQALNPEALNPYETQKLHLSPCRRRRCGLRVVRASCPAGRIAVNCLCPFQGLGALVGNGNGFTWIIAGDIYVQLYGDYWRLYTLEICVFGIKHE